MPALEQDRVCTECGGKGLHHSYSPPGWSSSDGLPTFEGCYCKGATEVGRTDDENFYSIPICVCTGFDPEGDES